jgi:hypothetical protein
VPKQEAMAKRVESVKQCSTLLYITGSGRLKSLRYEAGWDSGGFEKKNASFQETNLVIHMYPVWLTCPAVTLSKLVSGVNIFLPYVLSHGNRTGDFQPVHFSGATVDVSWSHLINSTEQRPF